MNIIKALLLTGSKLATNIITGPEVKFTNYGRDQRNDNENISLNFSLITVSEGSGLKNPILVLRNYFFSIGFLTRLAVG